jgi:hypothetical protein
VSAVGLAAAAQTVGVDRATLRRWRWRRDHSWPLAHRRGPRPLPIEETTRTQAAGLVRELNGLVGVEALRRSCAGLTRAAATRIKADTCTAMERERRARSAHVDVSAPAVVRGFDSMHLGRAGHLLVAADGAVPYRTSWTVVPRYDGSSVARALADDFARNGAPLVMRFDRAKQHDVPAVRQVLAEYGVLTLHGPPRLPRYYGQLERQNRDHRSWLRAEYRPPIELIDPMMASLNNSWRRRRLGWCTAAERWRMRPELTVDRVQMRKEVEENCRHLVVADGLRPDLGWRLAVEQALTRRGLLRVVPGGGC